MWRPRNLIVLVAAVGAGTVLSACGGGRLRLRRPIVVPTETTQQATSKTQFITQADSICAEANSSIEQFAAAGQGESEAAQIAQLRQGVIDDIKQINPPSDTNLDAFLKAMSDQVSAGQKIGLAVRRGEDPSQFETGLDSAKSAASQAASSYGFKDCGKEISASTSTSSSGSSSGFQLEQQQRRRHGHPERAKQPGAGPRRHLRQLRDERQQRLLRLVGFLRRIQRGYWPGLIPAPLLNGFAIRSRPRAAAPHKSLRASPCAPRWSSLVAARPRPGPPRFHTAPRSGRRPRSASSCVPLSRMRPILSSTAIRSAPRMVERR